MAPSDIGTSDELVRETDPASGRSSGALKDPKAKSQRERSLAPKQHQQNRVSGETRTSGRPLSFEWNPGWQSYAQTGIRAVLPYERENPVLARGLEPDGMFRMDDFVKGIVDEIQEQRLRVAQRSATNLPELSDAELEEIIRFVIDGGLMVESLMSMRAIFKSAPSIGTFKRYDTMLGGHRFDNDLAELREVCNTIPLPAFISTLVHTLTAPIRRVSTPGLSYEVGVHLHADILTHIGFRAGKFSKPGWMIGPQRSADIVDAFLSPYLAKRADLSRSFESLSEYIPHMPWKQAVWGSTHSVFDATDASKYEVIYHLNSPIMVPVVQYDNANKAISVHFMSSNIQSRDTVTTTALLCAGPKSDEYNLFGDNSAGMIDDPQGLNIWRHRMVVSPLERAFIAENYENVPVFGGGNLVSLNHDLGWDYNPANDNQFSAMQVASDLGKPILCMPYSTFIRGSDGMIGGTHTSTWLLGQNTHIPLGLAGLNLYKIRASTSERRDSLTIPMSNAMGLTVR